MKNYPSKRKEMSFLLKWGLAVVCIPILFSTKITFGYESPPKDELIESIHQRVRDLNTRMRAMGASNLPPVDDAYDSKILKSSNTLDGTESKSLRLKKNRKNDISSKTKSSFDPNTGFYFVPFGGLALVDDIDWTLPLGGMVSIEAKKGYSLGASFGYRWKYFYLEERISHTEAKFDRSHFSGIPIQLSGEISYLSFQQSIGLNFNFNQWSGIQLGAGAGMTKSQLNASASPSMSSQEDDWVFSYDGTLGIFFQPAGYFRGGINYRWLKTDSLDGFSSIDMHLIELALGLQF